MPIYDRQKGESSKGFAAAEVYFQMGPERSLGAVARQVMKSPSLITRWSGKWNWVERARAYDKGRTEQRRREVVKLEAAEAREEALRQTEFRKDIFAVRKHALKKTQEILSLPLLSTTTKDGRTTYTAGKWTIADAPKLFAIALKDLPKPNQTNDFRVEQFENVDFPPDDEEGK